METHVDHDFISFQNLKDENSSMHFFETFESMMLISNNLKMVEYNSVNNKTTDFELIKGGTFRRWESLTPLGVYLLQKGIHW